MEGSLIFIASILSLAGIYAIFCMILNMEAGWAGLWDMSSSGLIGIGAYVFVILTTADDQVLFSPEWPVWAGLVAASLAAGLSAVLIGLPALRLRGEYFLITTFAFSVMVEELVTTEAGLTRGAAGFVGLDRPFDTLVSSRSYSFVLLALVCAAGLAVYLILHRLGHSAFGRMLRAQRDNEAVALAVGKSVSRQRLKVFCIAGLMFGAVAPLYLWFIGAAYPSIFAPTLTFTIWTGLVIGGIGNLRGAILGAVLLIGLTEAIQFLHVAPQYGRMLAAMGPVIIGTALVLVMRFRPQGLLPEAREFEPDRRAAGRAPPEIAPRVGVRT